MKTLARRIAFAAGAVFAATACGFSAPVQDPPEEPVPFDEVVGLWENGHGETVEFYADGTFTADPSSFSERIGWEVPEGKFDGTWQLCESIYVTLDNGDQHRGADCIESDEGEYVETDSEVAGLGGTLLFTEDEQIELYPYQLEDHTRSEDYYVKVD
ncbi:hypothetical protein [Glycomyces harbinensis]|uniref:Lipoprotein n=1 Tax=Glycomyces harbinensis TaxID=58114 RepID=A0A1G6RIK4_9ACTN|nr:hypothetical protein [Glycomyces harbinensis]SDD04184.1 hypothetical protein SAMN05216270_101500 [Glycomyces harbinensis]